MVNKNGSIPTHVAIIPDGNRRWAGQRGKSSLEGHRQGVRVFRDISLYAADRGVKYFSAWGMSLDNFTKRSAPEVAGLLTIFRKEFKNLATSDDIHKRQVKINVIGRWREKFPLPARRAVEGALAATEHYSNYFLNFFLAYNGNDEMMQAIADIVASGEKSITPELLKQHLFTKNLPPVDLLIRTAGEPHNSAGFMMWDVSDSQLYFTETLWPAFTTHDFDQALTDYATRHRRFGK